MADTPKLGAEDRSPTQAQLANRIAGLPKEIQDQILDWKLLSTLPKDDEFIRRYYKTPWALHVDSRSRKVVANVYYGSERLFRLDLPFNVKFVDRPGIHVRPHLKDWLVSLAPTHRNMITQLRHGRYFETPAEALAYARSLERWQRKNNLSFSNVTLRLLVWTPCGGWDKYIAYYDDMVDMFVLSKEELEAMV